MKTWTKLGEAFSFISSLREKKLNFTLYLDKCEFSPSINSYFQFEDKIELTGAI